MIARVWQVSDELIVQPRYLPLPRRASPSSRKAFLDSRLSKKAKRYGTAPTPGAGSKSWSAGTTTLHSDLFIHDRGPAHEISMHRTQDYSNKGTSESNNNKMKQFMVLPRYRRVI